MFLYFEAATTKSLTLQFKIQIEDSRFKGFMVICTVKKHVLSYTMKFVFCCRQNANSEIKKYVMSSSVTALSLFQGVTGLLLESIPAVSGRRQDTPWTSRQLITGPSGAIWGSVSCSRTLRPAAQLSPGETQFEPATFRSLADLLNPAIAAQ